MPKINLYLTQSLISDDLQLKDKNVIVIDVLRATSTITVALEHGAKEVIAAESPSKAAKIKRGAITSLLCGERNGQKIVGFDLGNSPIEFTREIVKNKALIFSTTNGTNTIIKSRLAKTVVLASFLNLNRIADYIISLNSDVNLICSGKLNNFSLEDFICAGSIIKEVLKRNEEPGKFQLGDSENAAIHLAEYFLYDKEEVSKEKIYNMFKETEHGNFLISIGFQEDLELCAEVNSFPLLPVYQKEIIKLKEQFDLENMQRQSMKKINIVSKDTPRDK